MLGVSLPVLHLEAMRASAWLVLWTCLCGCASLVGLNEDPDAEDTRGSSSSSSSSASSSSSSSGAADPCDGALLCDSFESGAWSTAWRPNGTTGLEVREGAGYQDSYGLYGRVTAPSFFELQTQGLYQAADPRHIAFRLRVVTLGEVGEDDFSISVLRSQCLTFAVTRAAHSRRDAFAINGEDAGFDAIEEDELRDRWLEIEIRISAERTPTLRIDGEERSAAALSETCNDFALGVHSTSPQRGAVEIVFDDVYFWND